MSDHTLGPSPDVRGSMRVYGEGICFVSVCAYGLIVEEITAGLNTSHPTDSQWKLAATPRPCDLYPETHQHYLFNC